MRSDKQFPEGWRSVAVKDIAAQLLNGGTPSTEVEEYWKGTIPWVTGADFEDQKLLLGRRHITQEAVKNSATNVVPKGQLLVLTRTGVGKVAEAPTGIAISQDITGLIVDEHRYVSRFIYWQLDRLIPQLGRLRQGTSINGILREDIERFELPVPKSRGEQKRIAEIIDSVDNASEETRAVIKQTRRLKDALLQDLLTNGLPGLHKKFQTVYHIGRVPVEWEPTRLDEVAQIVQGIALGPQRTPRSNAVPYLRVANVQQGQLDLTEIKTIEASAAERRHYGLHESDALMVEGHANIEDLGRAALVTSEATGLVYQNHLFRVRTDQDRLDPRFLVTWINSPRGRAYFKIFGGTTSGLNTVGTNHIRALRIPLPEIQEQTRICDLLESLDQQITETNNELSGLVDVKRALSQGLLTGRISVRT